MGPDPSAPGLGPRPGPWHVPGGAPQAPLPCARGRPRRAGRLRPRGRAGRAGGRTGPGPPGPPSPSLSARELDGAVGPPVPGEGSQGRGGTGRAAAPPGSPSAPLPPSVPPRVRAPGLSVEGRSPGARRPPRGVGCTGSPVSAAKVLQAFRRRGPGDPHPEPSLRPRVRGGPSRSRSPGCAAPPDASGLALARVALLVYPVLVPSAGRYLGSPHAPRRPRL